MIPPEKQTSPIDPQAEEPPKPTIRPYDPSDKVGDPRDFAFGSESVTRQEIVALAAKLCRVGGKTPDKIRESARDTAEVLYALSECVEDASLESLTLEPRQ